MKYVITTNGAAILFPEFMNHSTFSGNGVVGAGFCCIESIEHVMGPDNYTDGRKNVTVRVWGKSESLKLDSKPEDAEVIERTLTWRA